MEKGLVLKSTGNRYKVRLENGKTLDCVARGRLRLNEIKTTNPLTVGDWVDVEVRDDGTGLITLIHERKNYIIRKATNLSREAHIIAANIDQALLIVTITQPETQLAFIDRYLVTAEAYRIPTILVFNKVDLIDEPLKPVLNSYISIYESIGYKCLQVSAKENINIDLLKETLKDKVSLLSGNSGVGKSTLINLIEPGFNLKTAEISAAHLKGRHTTTFSEIFELSFGGYIIDTPGIKSFGLVDIDKNELYHFFPEIFKLSEKCKYYNCTHIHEPGCAVIEAAEKGEIAPSRYLSYLSIYDDENEKYRPKLK
ncbi:MAG: ribosome biosis GTPase / thiamine phosphate phosphatase [Tenuifilum sp.]|jgi:ribosome biogenesis GTPase|uniref:ribosome small subunit-dependent GTPase A n=1 Tax=Tenuifilum sp. TaxID=2760880 RepID=UPI0024ABFFE2|nr:ribosome small subunit-dependent GTPase A [Tenuifilum sp.]MDI3526667.1 ribosome biosis GTPase / thiamine phosphate phosphatase [Tenuifilum sp.]